MSEKLPAAPEAERIHAFARFFKNYMSVSSVVVAALPIPVTQFGLIPILEGQKKVAIRLHAAVLFPKPCIPLLLATLASPADVPAGRHGAGHAPRFVYSLVAAAPLILIFLSVAFIVRYHVLYQTIDAKLKDNVRVDPSMSVACAALYVSIFVTIEQAFILMAIKEYLQDLLGLTEIELIAGRPPADRNCVVKARTVRGD